MPRHGRGPGGARSKQGLSNLRWAVAVFGDGDRRGSVHLGRTGSMVGWLRGLFRLIPSTSPALYWLSQTARDADRRQVASQGDRHEWTGTLYVIGPAEQAIQRGRVGIRLDLGYLLRKYPSVGETGDKPPRAQRRGDVGRIAVGWALPTTEHGNAASNRGGQCPPYKDVSNLGVLGGYRTINHAPTGGQPRRSTPTQMPRTAGRP